jgi:PAS domain S-box-containing protein
MSEGPSIKALQRQIEALQARNRLLDTLLENLPVGVFMADADSDTLAEAYQAYRSDTGALYPAEEMPIVQAMKGRPHHVDDMAVVHPDGSRVLLEVFGTPVRDDSGAIVASLVSFLDITESQRTKTELARLFDMSLDMICIADIATATFVKVNPAFTRTLGYSVEELLGRPFLEFIHPDDVDATAAVVAEKLRRGDEVINFKNRYRCKDGTYRWLSWTSHPDPQKGITYAIAHDITEEQAAADSCAALAAQWQTTFDAVNDCIWVLDDEWTVIQANKATVANLGVTAAQTIGRKCYEIVHGTASPFENCPVKSVIKTGQRAVELVRRGDRWLEITADPVFNADGSIKNIVHIITDITQRKHSDEALRQSEETLRSIFKAAPIGIGMVCNRTITEANERLCEMLGRPRGELIDQSARVLYPSNEDYEFVGREKYRQIKARGTGTVETRWLHKNPDSVHGRPAQFNAHQHPKTWARGSPSRPWTSPSANSAEKRLADTAHQMFLTVSGQHRRHHLRGRSWTPTKSCS